MCFCQRADQFFINRFYKAHVGDSAIELVTLEENSIAGGAGSGVIEFLAAEGIVMPVLQLGLPDKLIDHGTHAEQLVSINLDTASIQSAIVNRLKQLTLPSKVAQ